MSNFDFLILGHLIGDFLFQTSWMAGKKASQWLPLVVHAAVYTLIVTIIAWFAFGGLSLPGIALVFGAHVFLDQRTFVRWWLKTIMRTPSPQADWLGIVSDQVFHVVVLAIALSI